MRLRWLPLAGLPLLVFALYSDALDHDFVYDDTWSIERNQAIQLESLSVQTLLHAAQGHPQSRLRPISNLGFAFSHYFGGLSPRAFRLVNFCLHALNSVLVYCFLLRCLALSTRTGASTARLRPAELADWRAPAASLALLWAVHPVHITAVTFIHQRMVLQASCFMLLGLLVFLHARTADLRRTRLLGYGATALLGLLALGSKETGALFVGAVMLVEWGLLQNMRRGWFVQHRRALLAAGLLTVLLGMLGLHYYGWEWLSGRRPFLRIFDQSRAQLFYLSLLAFPHPARLNVDHGFLVARGLTQPWTGLPCLLLVLLLAGCAIWAIRRHKLLAFGLCWWFLMHALEAALQGLENIAEYRLYLASLGIFLVALSWLPQRPRWRRPVCVGLSAAALLCGLWTWQQNRVWRDDESLWRDVLAKADPNIGPTYRACYNLGLELLRQRKPQQALPLLRRATELAPGSWAAHNALSSCLHRLGRDKEALAAVLAARSRGTETLEKHLRLARNLYRQGAFQRAWVMLVSDANAPEAQSLLALLELALGRPEAALTRLLEAIAQQPPRAENHAALAELYGRQQRWQEAAQQLQRAEQLEPGNPAHPVTRAQVLLKLGDADASRRLLQRVVAAHPDDAAAHYQLGRVLELADEDDLAEVHYREALELGAARAEAWGFLGRRAFARQAYDEAIASFAASLRLRPLARTRVELAGALIASGRPDEGEEQLRTVLATDPAHGKAHELLGVICAQQERYPEAILHFEAALQARPADARVQQMLAVARQRAAEQP